MAKGINPDIPFAKDVDEWFDDFLNTVISVKPSWVEAAYRLTKAAEEHSELQNPISRRLYLHPQQNSPFSQRKFNPHNTQSVIFPAQGDEKMAI
jgi:hypothetical protein